VTKNRNLIIPAIIAGIVLVVIGVIYFAESAGSLPSFFPGHDTGSDHHHVKHGLLALILGIGCFVFAWFQTGPASRSV
jgi:divalent metal cation (Fe/Co/Zn/Cd) transporter